MDIKTERLLLLLKNAQAEYSEKNLVIPIPGFASKKFIAYCAMNKDLELLLAYIDALKENPNQTIKSALTFSLISLYGKCFTDASKNSYPKLEPSDLFKNEKEHSETHEMLMDLRHQFIAHRGETEKEIGIAFMLVPKGKPEEDSQIRFSQLKQISFNEDDLARISSLLKFIIEKLVVKIQATGQKLHDGMLKMFTAEELAMMIMNNAK